VHAITAFPIVVTFVKPESRLLHLQAAREMIGFRSLTRQFGLPLARILQSPRPAIEATDADEDTEDEPTKDMAVLEEFVQSLKLADPTAESRCRTCPKPFPHTLHSMSRGANMYRIAFLQGEPRAV
jgi:hypothetical protein